VSSNIAAEKLLLHFQLHHRFSESVRCKIKYNYVKTTFVTSCVSSLFLTKSVSQTEKKLRNTGVTLEARLSKKKKNILGAHYKTFELILVSFRPSIEIN
jgi:hypothetical protein